MSYEFRVMPHAQLPGKEMVECWRDGVFVAGVYPHEDGIRIVSKYMLDVSREADWPPMAVIKLSKTEDEPPADGEKREEERSYTCPGCGMTSYHPEDVRHEYCGNCHKTRLEIETNRRSRLWGR